MGTHKDQPQTIVFGFGGVAWDFLNSCDQREFVVVDAVASDPVKQASARGRHDPAARVRR